MKKSLKALTITLGTVVGLVIVVLGGARIYFRGGLHNYYKNSIKGFNIPGLNEGFVPQGLSFDEKTNSFFITGYMKDKSASPIYVVDKETKKLTHKVLLKNPDGEINKSHSGGLQVYGDYVYVCASRSLKVYSYNDIINAEKNSYVQALGTFSTEHDSNDESVSPACVSIYNNHIIVSEFYYDPAYPTVDAHKMETVNGDYNQARAYAYELKEGENTTYGISNIPSYAISMPDKVQGMEFKDDIAYISTSYGVAKSHIYTYDMTKLNDEGTIKVSNNDIKLYSLDKANLIKDVKIAPMSEEIVIVDNKMYTMCESASTKYFFGNLTGARSCYATDIKIFKD